HGSRQRAGAVPGTDRSGGGQGIGERPAAAPRGTPIMNSTTMATRVSHAPDLAVDIASASSRIFWLVRNAMAVAAGALPLPGTVFTRFSDAMAARERVDSTPPLSEHPEGLCRLNDDVIVDGVGPGTVKWIHPSGDVRVE